MQARHSIPSGFFCLSGNQLLRWLLLSVACFSIQNTHAREIRIVGADMRPWFYQENADDKGVLTDILRELVVRMGHQPSLHFVPFRRLYSDIQNNRADLTVLITSKNKVFPPAGVRVNAVPIFSHRLVVVGLKSRELVIDSLEENSHLSSGYIRMYPEVTEAMSGAKQKEQYGGSEMLFKALYSGRVDVAVVAEPTYKAAAKTLGIINELEVIYEIGRYQLLLAWSKNALSRAEVAGADDILRAMKKEGVIESVLGHYDDPTIFGDIH